MPYTLDDKLVVAISSRALFDLTEANEVFEREGLEAYRTYQLDHENEPLKPGTGYPLVRALLAINERAKERLVEVVLISKNDADSGLRIFNSIEAVGLDITRAAFTDGRDAYRYLKPFCCDLFLSADQADVTAALRARFPAALAYPAPELLDEDINEVRIAFDGDAVLFSPDSELVYQNGGLDAFQEHERALEDTPLDPGPFKGFLEALSRIQQHFAEEDSPIRTALVTARNAPAHKRPIKTLREWGVRTDESFFLGGVEKAGILEVFKPHIFFDDQAAHCDPAATRTPAALVPTLAAQGRQIEADRAENAR